MRLVKGESIENPDEERFQFPMVEAIAEVSCGEGEEDRPALTFADRASTGRLIRRRASDRGSDLGFAYQS